jgi:hypothetical protein
LGEPQSEGGSNKLRLLGYGKMTVWVKDGKLYKVRGRPDLESLTQANSSDLKKKMKELELGEEYNDARDPAGQHIALWFKDDMHFVFVGGELSRWGRAKEKVTEALNLQRSAALSLPFYPKEIPIVLEPFHRESTRRERKAIRNGKVRIGMTKAMVRCAWGDPRDVNRTVIRGIVMQEQWCYGGIGGPYLYFKKGELSSFQD